MTAFLRIVAALAKYGKRAVDWAWANRQKIEIWLGRGLSVATIVELIRQQLGL